MAAGFRHSGCAARDSGRGELAGDSACRTSRLGRRALAARPSAGADAMSRDSPPVTRLALRSARVLILTGAGISAESGVPTFRDGGGLWKQFRLEDLATPEAFARDPRTVWEWYAWRREQVRRCLPNAAHLACARFALARLGVTIVTQNVDGLHAAAARTVAGERDPGPAMPVELHGSLFRDRCADCAAPRAPADDLTVDVASLDTLPRCRCGGLMRPGVVWFGELLPFRSPRSHRPTLRP
jgi:NAD-dependent deacetylase